MFSSTANVTNKMAGDEKKMHHVNDDPDVQVLPGGDSSVDDEKRVRRKIDCVILPLVSRTLGTYSSCEC